MPLVDVSRPSHAFTCDRATDGKKFLFASFQGDTNGLCTIPVVTAVHQYASLHQLNVPVQFTPDAELGLSMNVYVRRRYTLGSWSTGY